MEHADSFRHPRRASSAPWQHTLGPGHEALLIVEMEATGDAWATAVDRPKLPYETGDWVHAEVSGTSLMLQASR